jgi:Flp pilus assembly CpaE family ATPase
MTRHARVDDRSARRLAHAARSGRLVGEIDDDRPAAREIEEIERLKR